jgi:type IV pilus assembly protein PilB
VGRVGIFEVLLVSDKIKELIFSKASINEIGKQAKLEGFRTMLEDGLDKVQGGITTLEEVLHAVRE